jgi:hypothetical protein
LREKHFRFLPSQIKSVACEKLRHSVMVRGMRMEYKNESFQSLFKLQWRKDRHEEAEEGDSDEEDAVTDDEDDVHLSATEDEGEEEGGEEPAVGQKRKREASLADADGIEVC